MTVLQTVLDNSVAFTLLFAGVWVLKLVFKKYLSARLHYMIWLAVLVGLLIPVRIHSGIGLWDLLPKQTVQAIVLQVQNLQPAPGTVAGAISNADEGIQPNDPPAAATHAPADNTVGSTAPLGSLPPIQADSRYKADRVNWLQVGGVVWLAGAAAVGAWLFVGGRRLRRHIIRCARQQTPSWLLACAGDCAQTLNMRQRVRIVLQPVLPVPAVMGVLHPILLMPESIVQQGSTERVRHILMHEFNHVKRGDLIVIALMNLLSAIYWFHPLVWLCLKLIRADMETSCDNDVIDALGKDQRQEYIRTLVHYSGMGGHARTQAALSLHDARIRMKKRIGAMFMLKKTRPAIAAPVILLVFALLLAASATGCLPTLDSATAWPGSSAAAATGPASPTATAATAIETAAGSTPSAHTQTPESSPSAHTTPAQATKAPDKTSKPPVAAASQWEGKYQPVLDKYREFANKMSKKNVGSFADLDEPWSLIAPDVMQSTRKFGYALRDMDGNGTPELFLLTSDGSIWAMYTLVNEEPKMLSAFWARNTCVLDKSDMIYTSWSDGAMDNGQDAYRMSSDGQGLALVERVAMESTDESGNALPEPRYYQCEGSETNKKLISKAQADAETAKFPTSNVKSGLEYVPLS